jgi:hypothetical protein
MKSLIVLFVLAFATVCFGADSAVTINDTPFGEALSELLKTTVLPVLGALVLGFISWAAKYVGSRFKIESLLADNNFVTQIAAQGVAFAEEKAANYAKQAQPLSNNDKLNAAIAYVMQMAPKVSPEQAQSLVTSVLATLPGVGATGNAAVGVKPVETPPVINVTNVVPAGVSGAADPLAVTP